MKEKSSILTQAVEDTVNLMSDVRDAAKIFAPQPFMKEKMSPAQFKAQNGISVTDYQDLAIRHGKDVIDRHLQTLRGE